MAESGHQPFEIESSLARREAVFAEAVVVVQVQGRSAVAERQPTAGPEDIRKAEHAVYHTEEYPSRISI